MNTKLFFTTFLLLLTVSLNAQTNYLTIDKNIQLPKDSLERTNLLNDLNDFLFSIKENKGMENWVVLEEKNETQILIEGIQDFIKNDTIDFKPFLINAELLNDKKTYSIQIAYISLTNSTPFLKAIVEFIAHKKDNNFFFSSPLLRLTKEWNTKTDENLIFRYQNKNSENVVNQYLTYNKKYNEMLHVTTKTDYYFCDDCESMNQMLRLAGILYKSDYNGETWNGIFFDTKEKRIILETQRMSRQSIVDPHDLFHSKANIAIPQNRNFYMICAGADIYAGCWGMNWLEIKKLFKGKMTGNKQQDWLQLYFDRYNFGESNAKYIFVTSFINGLIIEKVEKEQGFGAVLKLFASGDMFKDRNNFFKTLEEITGINERNFNKKVEDMIKNSLKDI